MALTRIDSYLVDLDSLGGITFDDQAGTPTLKVDATTHRVGIGTASPVTTLDVRGNSYFSGNVGIGVTNPNSKLDVFAGDGISITNSGDTFLQCRTTGTTATNYIEFKDSGGAVGAIAYNHTENSLWFKAGGTERFRITSDGNVGIGTTNPTQRLHVEGNILCTGVLPATSSPPLYTGYTLLTSSSVITYSLPNPGASHAQYIIYVSFYTGSSTSTNVSTSMFSFVVRNGAAGPGHTTFTFAGSDLISSSYDSGTNTYTITITSSAGTRVYGSATMIRTM